MQAEEYLQKNVRGILQPMVSAVLLEKPKDPILFMIRWLQNYSGIQSIGENIEQTELENLRKEVKRYKKNMNKKIKKWRSLPKMKMTYRQKNKKK